MDTKRPAMHPPDAINDRVTIARLTDWITSSGYAVADLKSCDSWPNHDGTIDLIDNESCPKGSFYAQVKKLPKGNQLKYTFTDGGKFLTYCREYASWTPILLIGVDLDKNCAYWLHMSEGLLDQLRASKTVHFKEDQRMSADDAESIRAWYGILARYANVARERNELEAQVHALLQQTGSNLIGVEKPEFTKLHLFLDEYNRLLDTDLSIIKKVYYPDAWKVGIAYADDKTNALSYLLYPIPPTVNDVAIKKLNLSTIQSLRTAAGSSIRYIQQNFMENSPPDHARALAKKSLEHIMEQRLLDHSGVVTLAREYIFAYVDTYAEQLGLSTKGSYTVSELEEAFVNYYPRWLVAAYQEIAARKSNTTPTSPLSTTSHGMMIYDPICIVFLTPTMHQKVQQQVASQIVAKTAVPLIAITAGKNKLSTPLFARMLDFVKQKGVKKVTRLYKPKDISLVQGKKAAYAWDLYSPDALFYNTKRLVSRFEHVYNKIVNNNFPHISHQLALVEPEHKLLFVYDTATQSARESDPPQGAIIYEIIVDKVQPRKPATFLLASDHKIEDKSTGSKWILSIDGEDYEAVSRSWIPIDVWRADTPLLDMVYWYLDNSLKKYFKQWVAMPQTPFD
jgi:hypothetical protein